MTSSNLETLIGEVLDDHYRLDKLLGAGGMGAVYKACHITLKRNVAVKVLHPDIGGDPSISKRFDREAQSASRLDHPNCVRVTDFGTTAKGVKYLVMELLEGEELSARLGQPWAPDAALDLLEQVFAGLEHAHACGIVHRDLKPENVFVTRDYRGKELAKLVDFGIAKLLDADGAVEVLTRAGMVFGTPRYMSPEQAAGGKVDERSDLYSVGVLAHELLSGKPPFDSDDLAAILRMQIMAPPPPLPETVPAAVVGFVESLLEKSRHERPESAQLARARIRELLKGLREPSPSAELDATQPTQPPLSPTASPTTNSDPDMFGATGEHVVQPVTSPASADPNAPLPSKPEAMIGHRVAGRFTLEVLLGLGGMGAVFRARDEQTGSVVAIKLLHAALAGDDELAARFEREADTASELEHPNIAPVFGHGTTPGTGGPAPYLVTPLLEGVELRALIGAPLEPLRAIELVTQLLAALEHAHAHAVVHRDLKPENVFVIRDANGGEQVQLVDFGLAKVAEGGDTRPALTQFGQVFGTPAYMSPEQCRGEVVDARTDLYATGVILHELLSGRAPFASDDALTLLRLQLEAPPPPLPDHLPPALREVVAGLLVKDREARIPDAQTATQMLAHARTHAETFAAPTVSIPSATVPSMQPPGSCQPTLSQPSLSQPSLSQPRMSSPAMPKLPRRWLYAGGAVVAVLVIVVAAWPTDSSSKVGASEVAHDGDNAGESADGQSKPSDALYVAIDRELSARNSEQALTLIRSARDKFPKDGGLLWREARALGLGSTETARASALRRYAEALTADPSLGEETVFEAELRNLLRDPKLRVTAIDVAVRELGDVGHSFLLEVINDESAELSYVDRHRILHELSRDPTLVPRIDLRRQLVLDLSQASTAPAPCTAFASALDRIAASDDPHFFETLMDRSLEVPNTPGVGEDASDCTGLDAKRDQVEDILAANHPEQAAKAKRRHKKRGKKRRSWLPF